MLRCFLFSAFVFLAACSQPAPATDAVDDLGAAAPAQTPAIDANTPDPLAGSQTRGANWAEASAGDMLEGAWNYSIQHDGTNAKAVYVAGDNYAMFSFECPPGRPHVALLSEIGLEPDQRTGFGIVTPDARYIFAAQSEGSGTDFPAVRAEVPVNDARLDALAASEAFAFQVAGHSLRIPNDPMVGRVLSLCRQ